MTMHNAVDEERKMSVAIFAAKRNDANKSAYNAKQQGRVDQLHELVRLACNDKTDVNYYKTMATVKVHRTKPKWRDRDWKLAVEEHIMKRGYTVNETVTSWIVQMPKVTLNK